jgi:ATP/maltotriose-dependent transcriptional regulator MalT
MGVLFAMSNELVRARAEAATSRIIYQELGMPLEVAVSSQVAAAIELHAGDPAVVEHELRRDAELLSELNAHGYRITTHIRLAQVLQALERQHEAVELVAGTRSDVAEDDVVTHAMLDSVMVRALTAEGRLEEAERAARLSIQAVRGSDRYDVVPTMLVELADVLARTGETSEARRLLKETKRLHLAKENAALVAKVDEKLAQLAT